MAASVSARRIDQGNGGGAGFALHRIAGRGFAVQRQPQDLAFRLVGILGGGEALAVAHREEEVVAVRREGDLRACLAALAPGHLAPQHLEPVQPGPLAVQHKLAPAQRQAAAIITRFDIGEIHIVVGGVMGREEDAQHAVLALIIDWAGRRQLRSWRLAG